MEIGVQRGSGRLEIWEDCVDWGEGMTLLYGSLTVPSLRPEPRSWSIIVALCTTSA